MKRSKLLIICVLLVPQFYVYPMGGSLEFFIKFTFRAVLLSLIIIDITLFKDAKFPIFLKGWAVALYAITGLAMVSTLYSSNPGYSGMRAADLVSFVFMGLYFSSKMQNFDDLVRFVAYVISIYILGFLILTYSIDEPIWRQMGAHGVERLGGFVINPNIFAYSLLFLLAASFYSAHRRPALLNLILIIAISIALYFCYSRSALLALFFGLFFIIKPQSLVAKYIFLLSKAIFVGFLIFSVGDVFTFFQRGHGIENLMSLGGRTTIWSMMIEQADFGMNLFWGFGFQMLSATGLAASDNSISMTMAHSNFLQTFLGLGIFGTMLLFAFWFFTFRINFSQIKYNRRAEIFLRLVTFFVFVYSLVEYGIFGPPTIIAPVFLTIIFYSGHDKSRRLLARRG